MKKKKQITNEDVIKKMDKRFEDFGKMMIRIMDKKIEELARMFKDSLEAFATKKDLEQFVTKDDLKNALKNFATKKDLKEELRKYATKQDLKDALEKCATKQDVQNLLKKKFGVKSIAGLATQKGLNDLEIRLTRKIDDMKGDTILLLRKRDKKTNLLTDFLKNNRTITEREYDELAKIKVFPTIEVNKDTNK